MAHESLVNQLVAKTVTRRYKAIVHGVIPHDKGTIDAPIARDKKERQSMTVDENGKHAVTHFQVLERFKRFHTCRMSLRNRAYTPNSCSYEIYWLSTCRRSKVWTKENIRYEWTSTSRRHFRI